MLKYFRARIPAGRSSRRRRGRLRSWGCWYSGCGRASPGDGEAGAHRGVIGYLRGSGSSNRLPNLGLFSQVCSTSSNWRLILPARQMKYRPRSGSSGGASAATYCVASIRSPTDALGSYDPKTPVPASKIVLADIPSHERSDRPAQPYPWSSGTSRSPSRPSVQHDPHETHRMRHKKTCCGVKRA